MRLIDADALIEAINKSTCHFAEELWKRVVCDVISNQPTAYDISKVVEEVKKLDLDGVSMVEDGKYKLVRKNEVISLIQTNGVCNGRHSTCADCYKKDCTLSTEKTLTDKWSEEVRKGGVE